MSMDGCISGRCRTSFRHTYIAGLLCLALAAVAAAAPKATQTVSDIRFWTAGDTTRVAIEVSGEFTYKSQRLSGPDRVFFDIEPAKLALKGDKPSTMPVNNGLVKQVRFAEKQPGTIRVVLDLEDGVEFTASQLSNPERLMVELRSAKKSKAAPVVTSSVPAPKPAEPAVKNVEPPPTKVVEEAPVPRNLLIPPVFATISGTSNTPPPRARLTACRCTRCTPSATAVICTASSATASGMCRTSCRTSPGPASRQAPSISFPTTSARCTSTCGGGHPTRS